MIKTITQMKIAAIPFGGFFLKQIQQLQSKIGASVVIQGSYNTGNIGDLAIGTTIQKEINKLNLSSHLNGFINDYWGRKPNFKKYDYHIIGGGGVIRDYPPGNLETRLEAIGTAKKGSFLLSVGFDGLCTDKGGSLIKKLDKCKFITVRDEKSRKNLQPFLKSKIELASCPTFLMNDIKKKPQIKDKNMIGLNLRDIYENSGNWGKYIYYPRKIDLKETRKNYLDYINKTLKKNLKDIANDYKIVFIPFSRKDVFFAKKYLIDVPIEILPLQPPKETLATINMMNRMICMRYHSIVFAILSEIPFFVISYHNKTKELLKEIKGVSFIDLLDLQEIDIDFTIKNNQVHDIKRKMKDSAKKNFVKLNSLLI